MCLTGKAKMLPRVTARPKTEGLVGKEPPKNVKTGWRAWRLDTATGKLRSSAQDILWEPKEPMRAGTLQAKQTVQKLVKPRRAEKVAPENRIGVHTVKDAATLKKNIDSLFMGGIKISDPNLVVGEVMLWGDVVEHDNGFRAENGYPVTLYANTPKTQVKLRELYDCNVSRRFASHVLA